MKKKNVGMPRPAMSILPRNNTLTDMSKGEDKKKSTVKHVPADIKQGKDESKTHYPLPY
ncbi:MAG: hypothetical protein AAB065_06200 [Deltaproteobacteria bacterium]